MKRKLSVIVPVYNMAADNKLEYCMDSLVRQTVQDMEIIAVDDASTDNSLEILRRYERSFPDRVRVIACPVNGRQGAAKNRGLEAASGEWIGFIDSDDWVTPDYYARLLTRAEETGADLVGCDYSLVSEHCFRTGEIVRNNTAEQTGVLDEERHKSLLIRPGSMVVKIYRASVIRENGLCFPEGILYEDNCAAMVWSLYFRQFERVEEPMYFYYQHQMSTVHRVTQERCRDRMKAMVRCYEEYRDRGFLEQYRSELEYRFTELYYVITLFSYMQGVRHPKLSFVRQLRDGAEKYFPDFEKNPYYRELTGREEQRLIALQGKSDLRFYWYYRLKLLVRNVRRGLGR